LGFGLFIGLVLGIILVMGTVLRRQNGPAQARGGGGDGGGAAQALGGGGDGGGAAQALGGGGGDGGGMVPAQEIWRNILAMAIGFAFWMLRRQVAPPPIGDILGV
jgi:hypothetical protein